jgi:hypothetical protein
MLHKTVICRNFFSLETASLAYFERKISYLDFLHIWLAYHPN